MDNILKRFRMDGKNVMVTGGAGGIGSCCAAAFAEAGANVIIVDLHRADPVLEKIRAMGQRAEYYSADVTEEADVIRVFDQAEKDFGVVHSVFNNAGICIMESCENMTYEQWKKVVSVNLNGVFLVAREAGRRMIAKGIRGTIVNTGSMSGDIVNYPQKQVAYNASKAGVIHLTKSLACEWGKYGIRVNCISPGYMDTNMAPMKEIPEEFLEIFCGRTPLERYGTPDELAGAVLYLASDASSFTTGSEIVIDGGYCCY